MVRKVLILAASPIGSVRLQGYSEVREIADLRQASNYRDDFEVVIIPAARPEDFQKALFNHRPEIVHFVGHGIENTGLMLETDAGEAQLVTGDRLREWFSVAKSVKCVILNACYSEVQATVIAEVVPCVIGTLYSFCDRAALEFSIAFYRTLFAGESYRDAFRIGKGEISDSMEANTLIDNIRDDAEDLSAIDLEPPGRRMAIDSKFYVMRPRAEIDAEREIMRPGALIRIKAPREFGKSSLMGRVVAQAENQGAKTVIINCRQIPPDAKESLLSFLQYFCDLVTFELSLQGEMNERQIKKIGVKNACTSYFEQHLLPQILNSLVLELDEVDVLLNLHPQHGWVGEFFSMLRAWYDSYMNAKESWKKLRLILVHSKQVPKDFLADQSPFNVGYKIELSEFNEVQVLELARRHQVSEPIARRLFQFVGGHPKLIRQGLYEIARGRSISEIIEYGATYEGIYGAYLQQIREYLESDNTLAMDLRRVLASGESGMKIDLQSEWALRSFGVIVPHQYGVRVACRLYCHYLSELWK